jgi:hypothetical protein
VRAAKGDVVAFECAAFLNRGSELHARRAESALLGQRRLIPGVESALVGMREGGYRKVRNLAASCVPRSGCGNGSAKRSAHLRALAQLRGKTRSNGTPHPDARGASHLGRTS